MALGAFFLSYWRLFLVVFVFLFLAVLSGHDYDRYPTGAHGEEQAFGWAGLSLLRDGIPTSWSLFDNYSKDDIVFSGDIGIEHKLSVDLVQPWFDHPPLFFVLSALGSYFAGEEVRSILSAAYLRIPSIISFWFLLIGVFYLAQRLFGFWTGFLSMVFLGTIPSFVFGARLAVPEVIFGLFFVLMMIFWLNYNKSQKISWLIFIAVLSGVAGMMKFTGFFLVFLFVFFLLKEGKFRLGLFLGLLQLPFLGLIFWYASFYDLGFFWELTARQSFRPVGWTGLPFLFTSPGYNMSMFYDGWLVMGFLMSVVFVFLDKRNFRYVTWPIFFWLAVLVVSAGQQDMNAWYRFPMFPFMAIVLAQGVREILAKPGFLSSFLVIGMLLSSRHYLSNAFRADVLPGMFRVVFFAILAPSLILEIDRERRDFWMKVVKVVLVGVIVVGVWFNIKLIYGMFPIRCESVGCPIGVSTWISNLRFPLLWRFLLPSDVYIWTD